MNEKRFCPECFREVVKRKNEPFYTCVHCQDHYIEDITLTKEQMKGGQKKWQKKNTLQKNQNL